MREAIGGAWLTQIVVFFVLLFAGYLAMSINISKAYKVKNEVIDIIERQKGIYGKKDSGSIKSINDYLDKAGYKSKGRCGTNDSDDTGWCGLNQYGQLEPADNNREFYMCIKQINSDNLRGELAYYDYYRIKVFYHLDIPIFGSLFSLGVSGDTANVYYPATGSRLCQ